MNMRILALTIGQLTYITRTTGALVAISDVGELALAVVAADGVIGARMAFFD